MSQKALDRVCEGAIVKCDKWKAPVEVKLTLSEVQKKEDTYDSLSKYHMKSDHTYKDFNFEPESLFGICSITGEKCKDCIDLNDEWFVVSQTGYSPKDTGPYAEYNQAARNLYHAMNAAHKEADNTRANIIGTNPNAVPGFSKTYLFVSSQKSKLENLKGDISKETKTAAEKAIKEAEAALDAVKSKTGEFERTFPLLLQSELVCWIGGLITIKDNGQEAALAEIELLIEEYETASEDRKQEILDRLNELDPPSPHISSSQWRLFGWENVTPEFVSELNQFFDDYGLDTDYPWESAGYVWAGGAYVENGKSVTMNDIVDRVVADKTRTDKYDPLLDVGRSLGNGSPFSQNAVPGWKERTEAYDKISELYR